MGASTTYYVNPKTCDISGGGFPSGSKLSDYLIALGLYNVSNVPSIIDISTLQSKNQTKTTTITDLASTYSDEFKAGSDKGAFFDSIDSSIYNNDCAVNVTLPFIVDGTNISLTLAGSAPQFCSICNIYVKETTYSSAQTISNACIIPEPSTTGGTTLNHPSVKALSGTAYGGAASSDIAIARDVANKRFIFYTYYDNSSSYIPAGYIYADDNGILPLYLAFLLQAYGGTGGTGSKYLKMTSAGGGGSGALATGILNFYKYPLYYIRSGTVIRGSTASTPTLDNYNACSANSVSVGAGSWGNGDSDGDGVMDDGNAGGAGGTAPSSNEIYYPVYSYTNKTYGFSGKAGANGGSSGTSFTLSATHLPRTVSYGLSSYYNNLYYNTEISNSGGSGNTEGYDSGGGGGSSFFGRGGDGTDGVGGNAQGYGAGGAGGAFASSSENRKGGSKGNPCLILFY